MTLLGRNVKWRVLKCLCLLVDILALSDQYANHVKVASFAGAPYMLECMLALVTLAQIEGQLVLCSAHILEHIIVGLPLQQGVANGWVAVIGCVMQRCPLTMVLCVDVSSSNEQKHNSIKTSTLAGQM